MSTTIELQQDVLKNTTAKKTQLGPLLIIGALFFIFGFITWVNGTLIPYLKIACQLQSDVQSYLVATAFFIAYTVMAVPSSLVLRKTGYKKGMALGLLVMALGAAIFIPAAKARSFDLFLVGLFIIGTGLALLQTASNPYVAILGPHESAATRISIMGICNKVAGILAGLIFGYIALSDADGLEKKLLQMDAATREATLSELAGRVINPYIIITIALVILAVAVLRSSLPDINDDGADAAVPDHNTGKTSVFQFPHLVLGVITLFLYVGVEVMAGDTIINYGKSLGIPLSNARFFTQGTLACMLVGYVIGIVAIPRYLSQQKALQYCSIAGVAFAVLAIVTQGYLSVAFIALLGLANSLMWPAIFPLAIHGLGRFTKTGSALLIMAIAGGAVLPLLYGKLAEVWDTRHAYVLLLPCYLFILFYAVKGYKAGLRQ
ncbi:sugar MFS transporter [Deminuibacter soli]|uniref:Glucose/galactose MFS transporter n=1 Tax=Deminuibacter soli TaxID=2291815 RepID=A0A3E1NR06_9BACT|nr:sugar MFS transporter [Deminuibacter soli]RFM30340.1 glucose/galactose MFS transporter [Deminuibacter soli]